MSTEYDVLIKSLALPDKVALLTGAATFSLAPNASIGLGEMRLSDGPTGVRGLKFSGGAIVALLPNATLLAAGWREDTLHEAGRLLGEEAMAQRIHVVLGPTINLHRTPLGGRLFEAYSEDPLLTGKLAAAYVCGLQELGVGASLKHLVANESETDRNSVDSVLDEATLRELYLLPFEIAVEESTPWTIMAAYNSVNGVTATEQDHVNNGIVKGEWGYQGLIMSDWFATRTAGPAANGGLDLVMPGPAGPWGEALVAAVQTGEVAESVVDDHLRRLLHLATRVGVLGEPREYPAELPAPDSAVRREQLTRLAARGMTVLRNEGVLPLSRTGTVALIGRHAIETIDMGGGSAQVNPAYQVSVAEGLTALLGDRVSVTVGVPVRSRPAPQHGLLAAPDSGPPGVHITLLDADGAVIEERHSPNGSTLVGFDDDLDATVATVRLAARLTTGGTVEVSGLGAGDWTLRAGDTTVAYPLRVATPGIGAEILAPPTRTDVLDLAGDSVLEATVQLLAAEPGSPLAGVGLFGLVARTAARPAGEIIAAAARAAAGADVAVVVVGLTEEEETEAVDKSTLRLPGEQDALVTAVAAAARRTVVVVNAATPVLMPWLAQVDAVLWAGLPGQEGGHAVAAALLGDIEPAGRLVTTFPAADGATPAWSVTPVDGRIEYTEKTFIGYRGHYAGRAPEPVFWLGHGLGYGSWRYEDARLVPGAGSPTVEVTLTNTGTRTSREVVQVYLRPESADQPVRLVGWQSVEVPAGGTAPVTVPTDARMWRRWDTEGQRWGSLPAGGDLLIARGLGDVRATIPLAPAAG
jgi:beta-glucosidase